MSNLEVFIRKFFSVDGLPARTVAFGEVASLRHKATDNPMEAAALVAKHLATEARTAGLTCAELSKVLGCSRNYVFKKFKYDGALNLAAHFDFEVNARICRTAEL